MAEQLSNDAETVLAAAITSLARPIQFTVDTAAAKFANFPSGPEFRVRIDDEILLVSVGGDGTGTWTASNVENTTAAVHAAGSRVSGVLTVGALLAGFLAQGNSADVVALLAGQNILVGSITALGNILGDIFTATNKITAVGDISASTFTVAGVGIYSGTGLAIVYDGDFLTFRQRPGSYGFEVDHPTAGTGSIPIRKCTTADINRSTASLANVTGLSFPIAANQRAQVHVCLIYESGVATTGIGVAINAPAGCTVQGRADIPVLNTADGTDNVVQQRFNGPDGEVVTATGLTVPSALTMVARIINGATAGTIQVRYRPEVAAIVTIREGSWMDYTVN